MLNIARLRDVLRRLETTSDLARRLLKRVSVAIDASGGGGGGSCGDVIINKEHSALSSSNQSDKSPQQKIKSSTLSRRASVTSETSSHASTTLTNLSRRVSGVGYGYGPKAPPGTNEIKLMMYSNNNNKFVPHHRHPHQTKTIGAALFNVSIFSRAASNGGGAVILESKLKSQSQSNSREDLLERKRECEGALNQNQKEKKVEQTETQQRHNQSSHNMSEAKVNEEVIMATQQLHENQATTTKQLDETTTSATATTIPCNGASCGEKSGGKEKSCFQSSLADILHFMELVGNLKHTKRTGWVLRDVNDCESISGHMYRMSMMTFLLEETEGLNRIRCMELALVHDLAESLVGDLTPFCGVAKEDKKAMELKAMADICKLVEPRGKRIMELFEEYEEGQSAESKFVKDLDRLDMVMQAFEYEKRDNCLMKHQEFFDSTEGKFQHPFIKKLVKEICDQRKSLNEAKLVANGELNLKTVTPNCPPCLEHKMEHHKNERS